MKQLMTGNEAIARGAYEAGLLFASGYPGTPSTEILENLVQYKDSLYCEWAPNEKVALEAALGASIAGVRSISTMKHVGVNVAADPLFTAVYTGINAGCVLVSADDPGMHSSQNEQDNRHYATASRILMLEPTNSQEAKEYTKLAFELSEKFDTPVMLRVTTRICHSKSIVEFSERSEKAPIKYEKNIKKYVATPANGKIMRQNLEKRIAAMETYSNTSGINETEYNGSEIGVISAGVAYQYARDVFGPDASYLKVGMSFPMPMALIREFASKVKKLYVIEEMDPYMENALRIAGIECIGKEVIPKMDELNPDIIREAVFGIKNEMMESQKEAVVRPPTLCAGCPHRAFFHLISKKKNVMITGDIGCYTLGSAPPLSAMDTCICMGASISAAHGAAKAFEIAKDDTKVVAVIGDSTFFHSGVTSLMNVIYNKSDCMTVILDNRITGMTGHQENPGSDYTLMGEPATAVDIPLLCKSLGFKEENVYTFNPMDLAESQKVIDEAMAKKEATVIIGRWPCALKKFTEEDKKEFDLRPKKCVIDVSKCKKCGICVKTGCPAIRNAEEVSITPAACTGCGLCKQVCPFDAITQEDVK
ncbi:MAG: indolepyruvate ferredoxin oxidoreductase subunit alpha [Eubacteriales bacterium]|nr:indolepyruvate ferredoxin oxidoreductase subunit alpha [Eubacteriales bacterium]MDD3349451.1 indolepyruvate ferredoxin oxidoreductase subunit alpha [Eubacteriales bacterium]